MIPQSSEISSLFLQVFSVIEGGEPVQVTFRNNFNLQDGFDGGVLELSTDGGNTFQNILTFGSFVSGGSMERSAIVAAIRSPAARHGPATPVALSPRW